MVSHPTDENFGIIPSIVCSLPPAELRAYVCLAQFADPDGWACPHVNTLARLADCTAESIRRGLRGLEARGLLTVEHHPGRRSHYWLRRKPVTPQPVGETPRISVVPPPADRRGESPQDVGDINRPRNRPSNRPLNRPAFPAAAEKPRQAVVTARVAGGAAGPEPPRRQVHTARLDADPPAPTALPGMPPKPPPPPTAGDLVAAWCSAWAAARGGRQPHPALVKRVAGLCRSVAKECGCADDWRDAWRAAAAAGRQGRFDVIGQLAEQTVSNGGGGRNVFAEQVAAGMRAGDAETLAAVEAVWGPGQRRLTR